MDFLTAYAQAQPDKPAVICDDDVITYGELEEQSNRVANGMLELGIKQGDKVTVCGHNSPEHFPIGAATRKIMAVGVPMNYRLKAPEMEYQLSNSESVAVFCGPGLDIPEGPWRVIRFDELPTGGAEPPAIEADMTGPSMTYTAGTTGNPKGAYRAKGVDPEVVMSYLQMFEMTQNDHHLVAGPMYHSAPGAWAGFTIVLGGTVVVMRRFNPEVALDLIKRHGVTTTFMAPTLLQRIVRVDRDMRGTIRQIVVAAAPCPFELKRKVIDMFGPVLWEFYGSSEAGVNTLMRPEEQLSKPGSCGKVSLLNDVRILDDDGNECPQGVPGEIFVRNPSIITEYYGNPEATKSSFRDDYFTVGDVGYFDEDGYLYVCDRKRDMIISGGANIYSAEIENVIHAHPKVWDVAIIGIPDEEFGESVHAIVQPKPGEPVTEQEIADWVAERLASYKKPKSVEFRDDFPRDMAGKIRKRELREPYWAGRETRV